MTFDYSHLEDFCRIIINKIPYMIDEKLELVYEQRKCHVIYLMRFPYL